MKIAFFDTHQFDKSAFREANHNLHHEIFFLEPRLTEKTAVLAKGADVVCGFANDNINRQALEILKSLNIQLIALRCAGYNCIDIQAAKELGIPILTIPLLARALYYTSEIGAEIHSDLYRAVATVLTFVYQAGAQGDVPEVEVPKELQFDANGRKLKEAQ